MSKFRVLSLDGGGIKGTFTASVLAELEKMTGKRIVQTTSTSSPGSVHRRAHLPSPSSSASPPRGGARFLRAEGPRGFFPSMGVQNRATNAFRWLFGPKYSAKDLKNAKGSVVGNRKLGESRCRLRDSFLQRGQRRHLHLQDGPPRAVQAGLQGAGRRRGVGDVGVATTLLPGASQDESGLCFIDGGLWANSPVTVAIIGGRRHPREETSTTSRC